MLFVGQPCHKTVHHHLHHNYIKYFNGTTQIYSWKSNGMSEENIENITKSNSLFAPTFVNNCILPDVIFNEHCLIKK